MGKLEIENKMNNNSIVSRIIGGLGNQFFQYAIGRTMAHQWEIELKLDISAFTTYWRSYLLNHFNIVENILPDREIKHFKRFRGRIPLLLSIEKLKSPAQKIYRKEEKGGYYTFQPDTLAFSKLKPHDVYFDGYWQNEGYFANIRDILINEFTLKDKFDIKNTSLYDCIAKTESIAIHFRRGEDQANKFYGIIPLEYYYKAIEQMTKTVPNPHFFIFSNEIAWVKNHFRTDFPTTFVSETAKLADYQELAAISYCKHAIIANSTFSWWGAWLNRNPHKIVVAPRQWLAQPIFNTEDFVPKDWIKI